MVKELDPAVVGVVGLFRSLGAVVEILEPWCPHCGESWHDPAPAMTLDQTGPLITAKCRDWHEVCNQCLAPYDQPKNPGCRRRKHPKVSSEAATEVSGSAARQEEK